MGSGHETSIKRRDGAEGVYFHMIMVYSTHTNYPMDHSIVGTTKCRD